MPTHLQGALTHGMSPEGHAIPAAPTAPAATEDPPLTARRGLRVDLGCGAAKAPGMVGVDVLPGEGIDHVVDLNAGPLPFPDDSVEYLYSSNTFEHLTSFAALLSEIPRVLFDRARFEFWVPRAWHNHAHVFGHTMYWNEESFLCVTRKHRDYWTASTGVAWNLTRLVFVVDPLGLRDAQLNGFTPHFAIRHLNNIVSEVGFVGHIEKPGTVGDPPPAIEVVYSQSRLREDYHPLGLPHWC
jgi:SAM-dependent methyltransferase